MHSANPNRSAHRPAWIAIGIFLLFAACMAALAGSMLLWPGTTLDQLWTLNPIAQQLLTPIGRSVGPIFLLLSVTLLIAVAGWFQSRLWGWRLAVVILSVQFAGDFINLLRGELLRGGIGILVAGALLYFLLRSNIRASFH